MLYPSRKTNSCVYIMFASQFLAHSNAVRYYNELKDKSYANFKKVCVFVHVWSMWQMNWNLILFFRVCVRNIVFSTIKRKWFSMPLSISKINPFFSFSQIQIQISSSTRCLPLVSSPPPCFTSPSCSRGIERLVVLVRCATVSRSSPTICCSWFIFKYFSSFSHMLSLWLSSSLISTLHLLHIHIYIQTQWPKRV
jgi:hypothetical protein